MNEAKQKAKELVEKCLDCNGTGTSVKFRTVPRCCMNFNEYGECCNYPLPDRVPYQIQCERCQATGKINNPLNKK